MTKISVGIGSVSDYEIPQVIHGLSANTMFFLINFEEKFKDKAFEGIQNMTHISLPHDLDDFSRIMNAYQVFGWTLEDIETAKKTARKLKLGKKIQVFLDNFMVLRSFYNDGDESEDDFKELLDDIHYSKKYQDKNNEEFRITL